MTVFRPGQRKDSSGTYDRRRPDRVPWDDAEIDMCMALYDDGYGQEDIAVELRRSTSAVGAKIRHELERRRRAEGVVGHKRVSQSQESERERRRAGYDARDFTSAFFGDPPRGFSALDKQRGS